MATGLVGMYLNGSLGMNELLIPAYPSTAFAAKLTALIAAAEWDDQFENKLLVNFTFANNSEVEDATNNLPYDARIRKIRPDSFCDYILTLEVFGYTGSDGTWRTARTVTCMYYGESTVTLGHPLQVNGITYDTVEVGSTGTPGVVIDIDSDEKYAAWLI